MKLLLDTCALLWWMADDPALSRTAAAAIAAPSSSCRISVVSLWEILAKHAVGRLEIDSGGQSPFEFLMQLCASDHVEILPLEAEDVRHVAALPDVHRDPFDRMLVCQAIAHGLTIVTPDEAIRRYPVRTLW